MMSQRAPIKLLSLSLVAPFYFFLKRTTSNKDFGVGLKLKLENFSNWTTHGKMLRRALPEIPLRAFSRCQRDVTALAR